jgi:hypothetical protein
MAVKLISSKMQCEQFMNRHKCNPSNFSRTRKLGFYDVAILLLRKSVKSLQLVLNEFVTHTCKNFTVTASAFTQARSKISYTAFVELNKDIVNLYYREKKDQINTYKGYRLLGFDGCKINVPENQQTIDEFGWRAVGNKHEKNSGICIRTTYEACYDVLNNIAISGVLGKGSVYEVDLAKELIGNMKDNDIGIFDRAYGSYSLIAEMSMLNTHFLIRCQRRSFMEVQELYESEEQSISKVVTLWPPYKHLGKIRKSNLPNNIRVRLVKIMLPSGEPEVLITSLTDEQEFCAEDFKEIYRLRWGIETFFGKLKGRLAVENFTGKCLNSVKQDIWATIFLSNLETIMTEDLDANLHKESELKSIKQKRINKSVSFNAIKDAAFKLFCRESDPVVIIERLSALFILNTNCVRPGRTAPRNEVSGFKKWKFHKCVRKHIF